MKSEEVDKYVGKKVGIRLIHKPNDWVVGVLMLDRNGKYQYHEEGCYVFPPNFYFKDSTIVETKEIK